MEPERWQHLRDEVNDLKDIDKMLDHWGNQGWELVSVVHAADQSTSDEGNILAAKKWILFFKQRRA